VSIDDRIRTATAATAATVREISPLALPDDLPGTTLPPARPRSRRSRRAGLTRPAGRGPRRLGTWLVPLAAAAAVIALAATLVAVRDLPGVRASGSTPAVPGPAVPGLPRYGAVLTTTLARIPPKFGSGDVPVGDLSVIDTHTGQRVALVKHPTNFGFTAVSGAADDRTFALAAVSIGLQPQPGIPGELAGIWDFYLLRIAPGSARPATLTRLSIPVQPDDAVIDGFALSPDGRTLAVMEWCTVKPSCYPGSPGTVRLYSVATGKALRTWTWGTLPDPVPGDGLSSSYNQNRAGLTWLADGRTLAFTYYAHGQAPAVRKLDTTRPDGDLVAASRHVFTPPASGPDACGEALLTPDGRTVVCAARSSASAICKTGTLEIDAYSAATGKRQRVLYRYTAQCTRDGVGALGWVGPGGTVVAMADDGLLPTSLPPVSPGVPGMSSKVIIGVLAGGKLTPLLPATLPFSQGLGTIAF
jgi:hypothetical protein